MNVVNLINFIVIEKRIIELYLSEREEHLLNIHILKKIVLHTIKMCNFFVIIFKVWY